MVDNGHKFEVAVVPEDLIGTVLHLGHNQSGHQWFIKEHMLQSSMSTNWKGMRKHIQVHCKNCPTCAKIKRYKKPNFKNKYLNQGYNQGSSFALISLVSFILPLQKAIVCINCCLYAYRIDILYPHQEQNSTRGCYSLEKSYFIPVWCLQKATDRQWH